MESLADLYAIEIRHKIRKSFDFIIYCLFDYLVLSNTVSDMFKATEKSERHHGKMEKTILANTPFTLA